MTTTFNHPGRPKVLGAVNTTEMHLERTPWFPADAIDPRYPGEYETKTRMSTGYVSTLRRYWDGKDWWFWSLIFDEWRASNHGADDSDLWRGRVAPTEVILDLGGNLKEIP